MYVCMYVHTGHLAPCVLSSLLFPHSSTLVLVPLFPSPPIPRLPVHPTRPPLSSSRVVAPGSLALDTCPIEQLQPKRTPKKGVIIASAIVVLGLLSQEVAAGDCR